MEQFTGRWNDSGAGVEEYETDVIAGTAGGRGAMTASELSCIPESASPRFEKLAQTYLSQACVRSMVLRR